MKGFIFEFVYWFNVPRDALWVQVLIFPPPVPLIKCHYNIMKLTTISLSNLWFSVSLIKHQVDIMKKVTIASSKILSCSKFMIISLVSIQRLKFYFHLIRTEVLMILDISPYSPLTILLLYFIQRYITPEIDIAS